MSLSLNFTFIQAFITCHFMSCHFMSFHVRSCRSFHACVHVFHCSHFIQVFHHKFIHVIYSFMSVHAKDIIVCNFMNFLLWYFMFCNIYIYIYIYMYKYVIYIYIYIYNCVILCINSFHVIGFEFSSLQFMSFMSFNVLSSQFIKVHAMAFIHSCHSSIALHCLSLHLMSCVHSLNICFFHLFVCSFIISFQSLSIQCYSVSISCIIQTI